MTTPRCLQPPTGEAAASAARVRGAVPRIATARLTLRPPIVEDFALWAALLSEDGSETLGGPFSAQDAWSDFCVYIAGWSLHGYGLWSVEAAGSLIGFVLVGLEWDDPEPELGYLFAAEARGHGYALEAATAARDHAARLLGAEGLVSYIDASNLASSRLAERLGARRDAQAEAAIDGAAQVWRHGGEARS